MVGIKTKYYVDVKKDVCAGMPFGKQDYKIRKVGYEITRLYFDTEEKDCQVGYKKIKKVIYA